MPKRSRKDPSSAGPREKHGRPNQGRGELRHITRTARRDRVDAQPLEPSQPSLDEDEPQPKTPKLEDGKAYDALLTLLKADNNEAPKKLRKEAAHGEEQPQNDGSDSENDIAGAIFDQDDENDAGGSGNEDDAEADDSAAEEDDTVAANMYDARFNQISDEFVAEKAAALSGGNRWPVIERTEIAEPPYKVSVQGSPGALHPCTTHLGSVGSASVSGSSLKEKVKKQYIQIHGDTLRPLEAALLGHILGYRDVGFASKSYTNTAYRGVYLAHVLSHVLKTRDRVLKNNERLRAYHEKLKAGQLSGDAEEPELRDQGFTRPKVLILLPTRNAAYSYVQHLIQLSGAEQQENHKKFKQQFFLDGGPPESKPADFQAMFKGNSNDFFAIGMKFTRKAVKLYLGFYSLDILVASPIGLSMILEDPNQSRRQTDFLSSIEILAVDMANQIEMQNWDHVGTVLKYINKVPKESHGADFSRIRMYAINDHARLLRQTMVFSEFLTPSINSLLGKSQNISGKVWFRPIISAKTCIMNSVGLRIKQMFQRFDAASPHDSVDARFRYFINSQLPSLTKQLSYEDGMLVYIPSYFDYVRVKAHMKAHTKISFASIDEYLSASHVGKARHAFAAGKAKVLLYTERMHHFRRYEISGVKNVLLYEPASNPLFYRELLRFVGRSIYKQTADVDLSFVKTIFCQWDAAALERIVGNDRAPILCNSVNEQFEFR